MGGTISRPLGPTCTKVPPLLAESPWRRGSRE